MSDSTETESALRAEIARLTIDRDHYKAQICTVLSTVKMAWPVCRSVDNALQRLGNPAQCDACQRHLNYLRVRLYLDRARQSLEFYSKQERFCGDMGALKRDEGANARHALSASDPSEFDRNPEDDNYNEQGSETI